MSDINLLEVTSESIQPLDLPEGAAFEMLLAQMTSNVPVLVLFNKFYVDIIILAIYLPIGRKKGKRESTEIDLHLFRAVEEL